MAHARLTPLLALTLTACLCALAAVGLVGGVSSAAAAGCPNANLTPQPGNVSQVRAAVLCLVDQERESHGEPALQPNAALARAAQDHSRDMAERDYFSHVAPDGETPLQRMRASGYLSNPQDGYVVGENIAWGTLWLATPQAIVSAWMASPGHRANILDAAYRETGVGVSPHPPASLAEGQAGAIYTQDFGTVLTASRSAHSSAAGSHSGGSTRGGATTRGGSSTRGASGRPAHGRSSHGSSRTHGPPARRITSAAQTSEQRSHTHGSTRRQSRHRHRVRARHRARHRRAARRARRARAHQRPRR